MDQITTAAVFGDGLSRRRLGAALLVLAASVTAGCGNLRSYRNEELLQAYRYTLGEQYIEVDGLTLCYQEFGSGPPVVILPGLGTSIDFWQLNVPALAEHHRVLALDLPGFGRSEKPDARYDLRWISEIVVRFMDARQVARGSLIGGSMGGHLALLVALNHPDRVDKLVLMGSVGNWDVPGPLALLGLHTLWSERLVGESLRREWPALFEKMFHHPSPVTDRLFCYQMALRADDLRWKPEARSSSRALRSIILSSCRSRLHELDAPTLLIWGAQDQIHPPHNGMDFRRLLRNARLVVVPDAAHEVMADQPEAFNKLVLDFLRGGLDAVGDCYPPELERSR